MVGSLFNHCLDYVARNICLVESFRGFPDLIGRKIFHSTEAMGQLDLKNQTLSHKILSLFTSAYSDVLTEVNIEGEHLLLAECCDLLMLFSHLKALNVSSCCLGDEHELLFHISTLDSLEVLILRNNNLTDEGIRKLTAPLRVKKTGPLGLKTLDLSENAEVTIRSMKFLRVFSALTLLNLSSTAVQEPQHRQFVPELQDYARGRSLVVLTAVPEEVRVDIRRMTEVTTQGWASQVISAWSLETRQRSQASTAEDSKAKRFYGTNKKKTVPKTPSAVSAFKTDRKDTSARSLILIHNSLVPGFVFNTAPQYGMSPSSNVFAKSPVSLVSKPGSSDTAANSLSNSCASVEWTGTVWDQTCVTPACSKLQSANRDIVHGHEERSSYEMSRGKRPQENFARKSDQRKRTRVERELGDDDLTLLSQYGYSGN